ncbi:hypothetical protein ACOSQ2_019265 [Xanthoceras sorbifolium]
MVFTNKSERGAQATPGNEGSVSSKVTSDQFYWQYPVSIEDTIVSLDKVREVVKLDEETKNIARLLMVEQQFLFSEEGKSSTALEDVLEVKGGISHGQQQISFQVNEAQPFGSS